MNNLSALARFAGAFYWFKSGLNFKLIHLCVGILRRRIRETDGIHNARAELDFESESLM